MRTAHLDMTFYCHIIIWINLVVTTLKYPLAIFSHSLITKCLVTSRMLMWFSHSLMTKYFVTFKTTSFLNVCEWAKQEKRISRNSIPSSLQVFWVFDGRWIFGYFRHSGIKEDQGQPTAELTSLLMILKPTPIWLIRPMNPMRVMSARLITPTMMKRNRVDIR